MARPSKVNRDRPPTVRAADASPRAPATSGNRRARIARARAIQAATAILAIASFSSGSPARAAEAEVCEREIETTVPVGITERVALPLLREERAKRGITAPLLLAHAYERATEWHKRRPALSENRS